MAFCKGGLLPPHAAMENKENLLTDTNAGGSATRLTPKAAYEASARLLDQVILSHPGTPNVSSPLARLSITGKRVAALRVDSPGTTTGRQIGGLEVAQAQPDSDEGEPETWQGDDLVPTEDGPLEGENPVQEDLDRASGGHETDLPTLVLKRFQPAPVLEFGKVPCGSARTESMIISNPSNVGCDVTVESFPSEKGFSISWGNEQEHEDVPQSATTFQVTVPAKASLQVVLTWTPPGKRYIGNPSLALSQPLSASGAPLSFPSSPSILCSLCRVAL